MDMQRLNELKVERKKNLDFVDECSKEVSRLKDNVEEEILKLRDKVEPARIRLSEINADINILLQEYLDDKE